MDLIMPGPVIREMTIDDIEESVSLIRKAIVVSNSKDYSKSIISNLLDHYSLSNFKNMFYKRKYYVALLNNRVVGTVACEDNTIYSLFVDPDHQKKGIGKSLLKKIEEYISSKGFKTARLASSLTSLNFYKINGYIEIKRVENYKLGDVIEMKKIISH